MQPRGLHAPTLRRQLREHIAPHRVDGRSGQLHVSAERRLHRRAAIWRSAGLGQAALEILARQRVIDRRLRLRPDRLAHIAEVVLHGQLRGPPRLQHRVKMHGHQLCLAVFVCCPGRREEFLRVLALLPRAEHLLALLPEIIPLGEALAREHALQLLHVRLRHALAVQRRAVCLRHHRDILRPLHAAFDLEGRHAHPLEIAQIFNKTVVLQAQRIPVLVETAIAVRQAARLRTLSPVARTAADHPRQIALPGIAHAERAMHEYFDLDRASAADGRDLLARQLPREHHAAASQLRRRDHALERMNGHLRRGVDSHVWRDLPAELHHPDVLHDERIHAQRRRQPDHVRRAGHLPVGHERVQRQMHGHAAHMAVDDGLLQFIGGEILRVHPRVELIISKIDRVGPVLYGGAQRLHRPGGREQFDHNIGSFSV